MNDSSLHNETLPLTFTDDEVDAVRFLLERFRRRYEQLDMATHSPFSTRIQVDSVGVLPSLTVTGALYHAIQGQYFQIGVHSRRTLWQSSSGMHIYISWKLWLALWLHP